jgi:hypothetical protein
MPDSLRSARWFAGHDLAGFEAKYTRGYGALYLEHVLQADEGCDFDFLRGRDAREPHGLLTGDAGWIGGW